MGVLEKVSELKNKGIGEDEIVGTLREQGVSPKEINDALSQSKIKSAVSSGIPGANEGRTQGMKPSIMRPERAEPLPTEGSALSDAELTPPPSIAKIPAAAQRNLGSMTQEVGGARAEQEEYVPRPQSQEQYLQPPEPQQGTYLQQEYSPQQGYGEGGYESYGQEGYDTGMGEGGFESTDTMIEIAEQVFSEKVKALQRQIESFSEFKTLAQAKIDNVSERLKRLETNIDRLQSAILEKVGGYGRGLETVKKEMSMMQDSFGKVVNKVIASGHAHTHHAQTAKHHKKTTVKKTTRKTASRKR